MNSKSNKPSPEVRKLTVRMTLYDRGETPSHWATIESIASRLGCTAQSLRNWACKHEVDAGCVTALTAMSIQGLKALEREVKNSAVPTQY